MLIQETYNPLINVNAVTVFGYICYSFTTHLKNKRDNPYKENKIEDAKDINKIEEEKVKIFESFKCLTGDTTEKLLCKVGSKFIEIDYDLVLFLLIENEYHIPQLEYVLVTFRAGVHRCVHSRPTLSNQLCPAKVLATRWPSRL